ncbi:MAG: hypothetical protein ACTTJ7_01135 [Treponema sp.]
MNKPLKIVWYSAFFSLFIVGALSCKSTPAAQEEPKPEVQSEPAVSAAAETEIKAEADTKPEIETNPETDSHAAEIQQFLTELKNARDQALALHADTAYPDLFKMADESAAAARSAYSANDSERGKEKAEQALLQYRVLINKMHINAAKEQIDTHHLAAQDVEKYQKGVDLLAQIDDLYASDTQKSYDLSLQALEAYKILQQEGFKLRVVDAKKKADEARSACDSIKAARSAQENYDKGALFYRQAGVAVKNTQFEQAYQQYIAAADTFMRVYEIVEAKRVAAAEAIAKAKERQQASRKLAQDADDEVPLPENTEGFVDEPIDLEALQQLDEKIDSNDSEAQPADSVSAPSVDKSRADEVLSTK